MHCNRYDWNRLPSSPQSSATTLACSVPEPGTIRGSAIGLCPPQTPLFTRSLVQYNGRGSIASPSLSPYDQLQMIRNLDRFRTPEFPFFPPWLAGLSALRNATFTPFLRSKGGRSCRSYRTASVHVHHQNPDHPSSKAPQKPDRSRHVPSLPELETTIDQPGAILESRRI